MHLQRFFAPLLRHRRSQNQTKEIIAMLRRVTAFILTAGMLGAWHEPKEVFERIQQANRVFQEIMTAPDKGIPQDLLADAHCIGIIPGMKHGGFIVGARYGKGVVLCRSQSAAGWTGPSTVRLEGGSVGLQIGGGEVDVVMLIMNEEGAKKLMESEFTLGADATVAAGPVGRSAEAETDAYMHAKILSYSRSRGIFAGVALEGATLRSDDDDNRNLYGRPIEHEAILRGKVEAPRAADGLIQTLNKYSS
jgi:lipid-binding SYLF domain-containing protein